MPGLIRIAGVLILTGLLEHEQKSEVAMLGSASGCLQSIEPLVTRMNQLAGGLVL